MLATKDVAKATEVSLSTVWRVLNRNVKAGGLMRKKVQKWQKGDDECMTYETKVILVSLAEIVVKAKDPKEIYKALQKMANVEGIVLQPFEEAKAEAENSQAQ